MNFDLSPRSRSFLIRVSAICHERSRAYSGCSSKSLFSSTTGICVPGEKSPSLRELDCSAR